MKDEYKELLCRVRFIDGVPAETYLSDVEIVRCKDCKHYGDGYFAGCPVRNVKSPDNFCSWAERAKE